MTDIHCHILPSVDDGSKSWEMTLQMCRIAEADGITHIVATPHANFHYQYDRSAHLELLANLREQAPFLEFSIGCDLHLSQENIENAIQCPERYVVNQTSYLLVEFSDFQTPHRMTESLFTLHSAGFTTIVTHPERNPIIEQYPDLCRQFADMGSIFQITAASLTGDWGRKAKKIAEKLLKDNLVSFIASDAHDSKHRTPRLSQARKSAAKIVGDSGAQALVRGNPCALISNLPMMDQPAIV